MLPEVRIDGQERAMAVMHASLFVMVRLAFW